MSEVVKAKKKILMVEDEAMLLQVLRDEFVNEGFNVVLAKDGAEGLEAALKEQPDLILVDILMPKMDGITMLQKIRQQPNLAKIPAIVLTNLNDIKIVQQALESGAYDYLVKSDYNPKDLVKHVKEKLMIG